MRGTSQSKLAEWRLSSEEARRQHWQWFNISDRLHADDQILIGMVQWVAVQLRIIGIDLQAILALCWGTVNSESHHGVTITEKLTIHKQREKNLFATYTDRDINKYLTIRIPVTGYSWPLCWGICFRDNAPVPWKCLLRCCLTASVCNVRETQVNWVTPF